MPIPSTMADLSATAASNSPAGSDAVFPDLDNYLRALQAILRQYYDDVASSASSSKGAGLVGYSDSVTYPDGTTGAKLATVGVWPRNNQVALLGDSITASGISNTTDETRNLNRGLTHWLPFLTSQRFVSPQSLNFGVSGETSLQIAARVDDVVATDAGVCVVLAGTNDIGTYTTTQTQTNLATIYAALEAAGIMIVAVPILPRTLSGESNYSFPQKVNEWMREQGKNYKGFRYIDPWEFGDTYSLTYSPRTDYTYDGLHPKAIGGFTIARPIAEHLNTVLPHPGPAIRSVCDYWNTSNTRGCLTANPMLAGTSGTLGSGISGSVADSHRVQAFANGGDVSGLTVTCSKSAATRTGMENQKIVVSGTATGGFDTSVVFDVSAGIPNISAGDVIELIADVEIGGATIGISGVEAYVTVTMNGTAKTARDGYAIVSDDYVWRDVAEATFRTPPITISGTIGATYAGIKIYLKNTGTTRSIDLRINNIAVRKVV